MSVANKNDLEDPNNYIPFYGNTDYPPTLIGLSLSYTPTNNYVTRLHGQGTKIGMNMALKVMAGDQVNIRVSSFYELEGPLSSPLDVFYDLLSKLNSGLGNLAGSKAGSLELSSNSTINIPATTFLNNRPYDDEKPKAFLNWIFFDEQFKYVSSGSGADQVGEDKKKVIN